MNNLKISIRLGIAFAAVLSLLIVISVVSVVQLRGLANDLNTLTDIDFPKTVWANNVIDHMSTVGAITRDALLSEGTANAERILG